MTFFDLVPPPKPDPGYASVSHHPFLFGEKSIFSIFPTPQSVFYSGPIEKQFVGKIGVGKIEKNRLFAKQIPRVWNAQKKYPEGPNQHKKLIFLRFKSVRIDLITL